MYLTQDHSQFKSPQWMLEYLKKKLIYKRNEIIKKLLKNTEFNKAKIFIDISRKKKSFKCMILFII